MLSIPIYQVDAFADKIFGGNPAAVCILNEELSEATMLKIAAENNLAETAFVFQKGSDYYIRWFTPEVEVELCGHATLASAHVLFNHLNVFSSQLVFKSGRGTLTVTKQNDLLVLNFPTDEVLKCECPEVLYNAFGKPPLETYKGLTDYMLVFDSESFISELIPDMQKSNQPKARGVIVTAQGNSVDFVSRFFAPQSGISEDPVTGSAHTTLIPYWAGKLNKNQLKAIQLSSRKGYLDCKYLGERVEIAGKAVTYLIGEIFIPQEV